MPCDSGLRIEFLGALRVPALLPNLMVQRLLSLLAVWVSITLMLTTGSYYGYRMSETALSILAVLSSGFEATANCCLPSSHPGIGEL